MPEERIEEKIIFLKKGKRDICYEVEGENFTTSTFRKVSRMT